MFVDEANFVCQLIPLIEDAFEKSIIFSPSSILTGLALFYVGCDGETAEEVKQLIGKDKTREEIIKQFSSMLCHYKEKSKNSKENVIVKFANKIFVANWCELLTNYCEVITKNFDGGFQQLDFSENEATALVINDFVKSQTNGLIKQIVDKNDIKKDSAAILVNTVYFKAPWDLLFENFKTIEFKSQPSRNIKMMCRGAKCLEWNYVESEKWKCLGIPYENYAAWIYFVLPNENYSLKDLEINSENFRKWTEKKPSPYVDVEIPFIDDCTFGIDLREKLEKLGMKTAFTEKCNVSNMTKSNLLLGKVLHKSTITIDEKGTEASSASVCCMFPRSAGGPKHFFIADRPFLYFITTVKEQKLPESSKTKNENVDSDDEYGRDNIVKYTREPLNLLFVGTFC